LGSGADYRVVIAPDQRVNSRDYCQFPKNPGCGDQEFRENLIKIIG
jgi:hypothetical protein